MIARVLAASVTLAAAAVLGIGPASAGSPVVPLPGPVTGPDQGVLLPRPPGFISPEISYARVYVNRMPCVGKCDRKSVVVLSLKAGCWKSPIAGVVSQSGSSVSVLVRAERVRGNVCPLPPRAVSLTVAGVVDSVVDARTGLPVELVRSATY